MIEGQRTVGTPRVTRRGMTPDRLDRLTRGLRLSDVSGATGICIATLSEIERGLRNPSDEQRKQLRSFYEDV